MTYGIISSQARLNKRKTWLILSFFVVLVSTLGYLTGRVYGYGLILPSLAIISSLTISCISLFSGDRMALSISNAKKADREKYLDLYTICENMAISAGLPKPRVFVIDDDSLNAFSTGRDPQHATICLTRGLVEKLNTHELEGVVAHEVSHVLNYDTRLMLVMLVLIGTASYILDFFLRDLKKREKIKESKPKGKTRWLFVVFGLLLFVTAPILASLMQLAVSRKREFLADAQAALLTRNPNALADTLEKISKDKNMLSSASFATEHLFISNPFLGKKVYGFSLSLFDTHPPIEERIKILRAM